MTEKLKSCPFCGGTANIAKGQIEFWAYCPHCGMQTELFETEKEVVDAWNRRSETELAKQFMMLRSLYINKDKNLIVRIERTEPNVRRSYPLGISYNFDNIRGLNDVEKEVLSKLLTGVKKELCDGVPYEASSYSCRACESAHREMEDELQERIGDLESENKCLRKALAKARHYLSKVDCYLGNISDEADYFWKVKIDEVLNGGKK